MEYVLTDDHIEELRERAKWAVHNGGTVNINCLALLALLPAPAIAAPAPVEPAAETPAPSEPDLLLTVAPITTEAPGVAAAVAEQPIVEAPEKTAAAESTAPSTPGDPNPPSSIQ